MAQKNETAKKNIYYQQMSIVGNILEQPELVDKLIMFFGSYFDAPYEGNDLNLFFNYVSKADFSTLKSNVNEYNEQIIDRRTNKAITITRQTA